MPAGPPEGGITSIRKQGIMGAVMEGAVIQTENLSKVYKRLFRDFTNMRGQTVTANDNIFVLPIPDDEYEYANIERPGTGASQN